MAILFAQQLTNEIIKKFIFPQFWGFQYYSWIMSFLHAVIKYFGSDKKVRSVFLDLSEGFDCLILRKIIDKIENKIENNNRSERQNPYTEVSHRRN